MTRVRRLIRLTGLGIALFLLLGVSISQQFPALTSGPKSSAELIAAIFKAPIEIPSNAVEYALGRVKKDAITGFVELLDAPPDVKGRVIRLVQGDQFDDVTAPFVCYLYDLYAAPAAADSQATTDLSYGESAPAERPRGPGITAALQHPAATRRYASNALRLFDALFLRTKPGSNADSAVPDRYDPAAYEEVKSVVRELAAEFLPPADDANGDSSKSEYVVMFEETLRDDEKLSEVIEFFTDLIRELANSWLQSFVHREKRKESRQDWVEQKLRQNRYFEIADYARSQAERRIAVHLAVDGLQGKLLEGLVQLSSGDRTGSGARYVIDLVREYQEPRMDPSQYDSGMPPALGATITELVQSAPQRPEYLENFKKYFFAPAAPAVVVNVATVDTPSISVRNLPIVYSGHGVPGPYGTGIPNFSYLNRDTGRGWYFWGSDVLHMRDIFANREDRVPHSRRRDGPGARTLMEHLWKFNTVSAMATIDTGALEKLSSEVGMGIGELQRNFIEKVLIQRMRERADMERQLNDRRRWLMDHRSLSDSLLGGLITRSLSLKTFREYARYIAEHEDEGLPDYLLWYNPWPDHFAHGKGPYSDFIIGYDGEYDRLDFYIGKLMEAYESVPVVSGFGTTYADRALFGVVSDHGLVYTPLTVSTDELLFEGMRRDGIDISYVKLTHDEGGLPAIHGRAYQKPTRPFDAVVGSTAGGSYIIDLFDTAAAQNDPAMWSPHPHYESLRSYRLLSGESIDFVARLKTCLHDVLDFAVVRDSPPQRNPNVWDDDSIVRIVTPQHGDARIHRRPNPHDWPDEPPTLYRYELVDGTDPLDLTGSVRDYLISQGGPSPDEVRSTLQRMKQSREGFGDAQWQEVLSYTLRADSIYQLSHLYDSDRAGTVNCFPVAHVGMNSGVPGRHAGESFGEKNGTQLYRGAGLKRGSIQTARNGSLPVTLFHWLVGDDVYKGSDSLGSVADQFGYASLLTVPAFRSIHASSTTASR